MGDSDMDFGRECKRRYTENGLRARKFGGELMSFTPWNDAQLDLNRRHGSF